ncbi:MAG TPA: tRNA pseudouridine(55) synthase, partial [Paludibacteraceae bacterium]|nr:tRNA pseudouridine(55) synthase [Paludibacteraceae bacterium]
MDVIAGEVFYVDKPLHWTSFNVVDRIRKKITKKLKIKNIKVGH